MFSILCLRCESTSKPPWRKRPESCFNSLFEMLGHPVQLIQRRGAGVSILCLRCRRNKGRAGARRLRHRFQFSV